MTGSAILVSLKIGRMVYDITEADKFLDNGACIQIMTRRGPWSGWHRTIPVLTKTATHEIGAFARVNHPHCYGEGCTVFSLQNATAHQRREAAYGAAAGSTSGGAE